jgi:subtilase family serine protease
MRFQLVVGALVLCLIGSAVAFAATGSRASARPDLVVRSVSDPPHVGIPGESFAVKDTTQNVGAAAARSTSTGYYYVSADGTRTPGGRHPVSRLSPHRASARSSLALVPATIEPGTYSFIACADATRVVRESNERNNCRTAATKLIVRKTPHV